MALFTIRHSAPLAGSGMKLEMYSFTDSRSTLIVFSVAWSGWNSARSWRKVWLRPRAGHLLVLYSLLVYRETLWVVGCVVEGVSTM
jgi:hypothetical protein